MKRFSRIALGAAMLVGTAVAMSVPASAQYAPPYPDPDYAAPGYYGAPPPPAPDCDPYSPYYTPAYCAPAYDYGYYGPDYYGYDYAPGAYAYDPGPAYTGTVDGGYYGNSGYYGGPRYGYYNNERQCTISPANPNYVPCDNQ